MSELDIRAFTVGPVQENCYIVRAGAGAHSPDGARESTRAVLFQGSVGRVDLPGGDWPTLERSIGSLMQSFPPETVVFPGHMAVTTLGRELETNPFLRELRAGVPQTAAPPGGTAPAS